VILGGTTGCCCRIFGVLMLAEGSCADPGVMVADVTFEAACGVCCCCCCCCWFVVVVGCGLLALLIVPRLELRLCRGGGSGMIGC